MLKNIPKSMRKNYKVTGSHIGYKKYPYGDK